MGAKRKHVMAIDSNFLMMRADSVFSELSTKDGRKSGIVYGYIRAFVDFLTIYNPDYYIPLFDHHHSRFRSTINAGYKKNRKEKPAYMIEEMAACREFVRLAGWTPYREYEVEADDLAAKIAKELSSKYLVQLVSVDHDWQQLTGDNVFVIRPGMYGKADQIVSYSDASEKIGLPAERWPEIAAIQGDIGDNVIGIDGYGPKRSLNLIKKYGNLWNACTKDEKLKANSKRILDNYRMTVLDGTVAEKPIPLEDNRVESVKNKIYDNDEIMDFLNRWGMDSIKEKVKEHELW